MRITLVSALALAVGFMTNTLLAQVPENLVVEGVPSFTPELRAEAARYMEFRAAAFQAWRAEVVPARGALHIPQPRPSSAPVPSTRRGRETPWHYDAVA